MQEIGFRSPRSPYTCNSVSADMQLIDTHSHLDFFSDWQDVLRRGRDNGVIAQILPGVYRRRWAGLFELCRDEDNLFAAPGLHPLYLREHCPDDLDELAGLARAGDVVALGEIGLDYYISNPDFAQQQYYLEEQLRIAGKHDVPILLHVRKAHDQVQAMLRRLHFPAGGIVHAYSGSLQQARKYVDMGFKISLCGTITYDRATKIRAIAAQLPLDALVLETDAPDIPPRRHHGQRNSPEYLPLVLEALAELRPEPAAELAERTTANALQVLRLQKRLKSQ